METSSFYFTFSTGMVKYSQEIALENATKPVHRNIYLETDSSVDKKNMKDIFSISWRTVLSQGGYCSPPHPQLYGGMTDKYKLYTN